MFTGLIEAQGVVQFLGSSGTSGRRLRISQPQIAPQLQLGESVAVNGACLTVVETSAETFDFEISPETLRKTSLGALEPGSTVNLERALRLGDRLGGHLVQGHVDSLGTLADRQRDGDWEIFWFTCPPTWITQLVPKGSITVDGVSLTVVDVQADRFSVALIPHTLSVTTLGSKQPGSPVNLETDIIAKYIARQMEAWRSKV